MPADRKTIQIASRRFRVAASNLYSCDFADYNICTERLLSCIESEACTSDSLDQWVASSEFEAGYIENELAEVKANWGSTFDVHTNEEKQAAFVYLILKQALAESSEIIRSYGYGYSRSKHLQDWADSFTKRFVSALIDAIDQQLEEQLILSDNTEDQLPLVSVQGDQAQINIADHGSHLEASMMNLNECSKLDEALDNFLSELKEAISPKEYSEAVELAESIKEEVRKDRPKRSVLKAATSVLKGMANTANLIAASITIEQAIQPFLS